MSANSIEIILSRQLADSLSTPIFLVDTKGNLIFYNEPAEELLGQRFEETGKMPMERWSVLYNPTDENGDRIPSDFLPLVRTVKYRTPHSGILWISNLKGTVYKISVNTCPIIGRPDRFLGAIAILWKIEES